MRRCLWGVLLLLLGCAQVSGRVETSPATSSDSGAADVIEATERLLDAIRDRDMVSVRQMLDPAVRFFAVRAEDPARPLRTFDAEEFLRIIAQSPEPFIERIWNPQVQVDGPLANLWTEYDVHVGPRFSHCGRAAFQFVLREGRWILVAETYTVRFSSCDSSTPKP